MSSVNPLDLKRESTWQNIPCPVDLSSVKTELAKLGAIPPNNGEFSGKPLYTIVWGQEHKNFILGKQRLVFDEKNINAKIIPNHYAVSPELFAMCLNWLEKQEQIRKQKYLQLKLPEVYAVSGYADISKFIEKHTSLEWRKLKPHLSPEQIAVNLPKNWRYIAGHNSFEEIGEQAFYVLQWVPAIYNGTYQQWTDERYFQSFVPEIGAEVMIDNIGEYPTNGGYFHVVLRVATQQSENFWNYREPETGWILPRVKNLIQISNSLKEKQKSAKSVFERRMENYRKEVLDKKNTFIADALDEAGPTGIISNIAANKNIAGEL